MSGTKAPERAAIGFTVKSGWGCAVLWAGPPARPRVLASRRVDLSDPAVPESRQPYHAASGTARTSDRELARLIASVRRFGRRSVTDLIRAFRAEGPPICGAAIVVGSLIDPERIANAHIRIHAFEGQLFRRVVEEATTRSRVACSVWRERDLLSNAVRILGRSERDLRAALAAVQRPTAGPWRAEHKAAALAAWLALAECPQPFRTRPTPNGVTHPPGRVSS